MNAARQISYLPEAEKHLVRALLYFDIFNYPLKPEEIAQFSSAPVNFSYCQTLERLTDLKILFYFQGFYSLQDDQSLVQRRLRGNALAEKKIKTAKRFSYWISMFPFVRAVMLSGSISKNYMDEKSDIDYFIITDANRLWIVRTALAIFRRVFLFNSGKNLCTNYFVDVNNLEINEKNIFTAIELCTIKPMYGRSIIDKFLAANRWTFSFLPNFNAETEATSDRTFFLKKVIETIFSFTAVDRVNTWLLNKSIAYWKRRYVNDVDKDDFEIAFRSTTGISKSHPQFFQKRVLSRYDQKIMEFETGNGIDLSL
jgi:hypothetical protein